MFQHEEQLFQEIRWYTRSNGEWKNLIACVAQININVLLKLKLIFPKISKGERLWGPSMECVIKEKCAWDPVLIKRGRY